MSEKVTKNPIFKAPGHGARCFLGFSRNEHYAEKPFFVTTIVDFAKKTK